MLSGNDTTDERREVVPAADERRRRWGTLRPRRPKSIWGWLLWLIVMLLFYLLVFYVLIPWYQPVPTDVPPPTPNSNTGRAG
jgi:polyferredoxin